MDSVIDNIIISCPGCGQKLRLPLLTNKVDIKCQKCGRHFNFDGRKRKDEQKIKRIWPSGREFSEAIQNPSTCFLDPEYKASIPSVTRLGLPYSMSGQFATVFKLNVSGRNQAVRCFTREVGDRGKRYTDIDDHLDKVQNISGINRLASYEYDPEGFNINGKKYPCLFMEWVEGNSLDVYIDQIVKNKEALLYLAEEWLRLIKVLKEAQIAHGDLQHGNIMVSQASLQLRLVDFDGMYVPEMNGLEACELGLPDYQSPLRTYEYFKSDLDNFSSLVIYVSILAVAHQPDLWTKFHGEGLIIKQKDLKDPYNSQLFKAINRNEPTLKKYLELLISCCNKPLNQIPSLLDSATVTEKSGLPLWMRAPVGATVEVKTREVKPAEVVSKPSGTYNTNTTPQNTQTQAIPTTSSFSYGKFIGKLIPNIFIFSFWWVIASSLGRWDLTWSSICGVVCLIIAINKTNTDIRNVFKTKYAPTYQRTPTYNFSSTPTVSVGNYIGSNVRLIYHRPHCEWAIKISARNRISFASVTEARNKNYRPCKVCRP